MNNAFGSGGAVTRAQSAKTILMSVHRSLEPASGMILKEEEKNLNKKQSKIFCLLI